MKFVIEQELLMVREGSESKRIALRLSEPVLERDAKGDLLWSCYPRLDGLIELRKPVREVSSFRAVVRALQACRQLLREEAKNARIYMVGGILGDEPFPEGGLSLKELFETA